MTKIKWFAVTGLFQLKIHVAEPLAEAHDAGESGGELGGDVSVQLESTGL